MNSRADFNGINLPNPLHTWVGLGTTIVAMIVLGATHLTTVTKANNRTTARSLALEQVAKYRMAEACRPLVSKSPIEPGTILSYAATQCFEVRTPSGVQMGSVYPGILNHQFQAVYTFTEKEVRAKQTQIEEFSTR